MWEFHKASNNEFAIVGLEGLVSDRRIIRAKDVVRITIGINLLVEQF